MFISHALDVITFLISLSHSMFCFTFIIPCLCSGKESLPLAAKSAPLSRLRYNLFGGTWIGVLAHPQQRQLCSSSALWMIGRILHIGEEKSLCMFFNAAFRATALSRRSVEG